MVPGLPPPPFFSLFCLLYISFKEARVTQAEEQYIDASQQKIEMLVLVNHYVCMYVYTWKSLSANDDHTRNVKSEAS